MKSSAFCELHMYEGRQPNCWQTLSGFLCFSLLFWGVCSMHKHRREGDNSSLKLWNILKASWQTLWNTVTPKISQTHTHMHTELVCALEVLVEGNLIVYFSNKCAAWKYSAFNCFAVFACFCASSQPFLWPVWYLTVTAQVHVSKRLISLSCNYIYKRGKMDMMFHYFRVVSVKLLSSKTKKAINNHQRKWLLPCWTIEGHCSRCQIQ